MGGGKDPGVPTTAGGRCARRHVTATIIAVDARRFVGANHCLSPQDQCPRAGMPRYTGYVLCRNICRQPAHAEVNALLAAGAAARGATMVVEGIDHICDDCMRSMRCAGIARLVVSGVETEFNL